MSTSTTKSVPPSQRVPGVSANQYPPDAMPKIGRLVFHAAAAAVMIQGWASLQNMAMKQFMESQYGGSFQYLTILGLFGSIAAMMLSGLCDYFPGINVFKSIKRIFLLVSLPVELVISSIYWSIILLAPELMLPPAPDMASSPEPSSSGFEDGLFRIPLWMDMSMHLAPAVALIIDFFFLEKKFRPPASTIGAFLLAATFGTTYGLWVEHCASINGSFPYPFLTIMELPGRVATYAGSTVGAYLVFRGLNAIHK
ncbi:hypothetical protein I317_07889 [Kwoniella heveanensis CBS 569]|nr:hypothetical protein I317_07889 [Kwoniella heveanensis CBS 569]